MFNIFNLFAKSKDETRLSRNEIAKLLQTTPEALASFERAYAKAADEYNKISGSPFDHSKKDARDNHTHSPASLNGLIDRIVEELVASMQSDNMIEDQQVNQAVTREDIKAFPKEEAPQLSANLYAIDCDPCSSAAVLWSYQKMTEATNPKEKAFFYHHFRQGLDILDLDPVLYEMLGQNPNSIGHWFPALKKAVDQQDFFTVPETRYIKVPLSVLQMSRLQYETLTPATMKIINDFCMKAFDLDVNKSYFVKTGTYSSKFDFRNALVTGEKEVRELGEYLLYLSHQAVMIAGPLSQPSIYGMSTTNEWCVREFIYPKMITTRWNAETEGYDAEPRRVELPTIYKGLPLRPEYRVFCDFDTDEILGISPYWRSDVMLKRFGEDATPYSPHDKHDYVIYKMFEPVLNEHYSKNKEKILEQMELLIPKIELEGQWSVDVMQNGDDEFYIIDMATADTSALSDCVPSGRIHKREENWLPQIASAKAGQVAHHEKEVRHE